MERYIVLLIIHYENSHDNVDKTCVVMRTENRLWVIQKPLERATPIRLQCAMPNSQKALKRGSAEAQTLWCIAGALQNRSGSVLNAPGLKMEVERSRELMDDRNPPAQALV
jgi:hypothetical protein